RRTATPVTVHGARGALKAPAGSTFVATPVAPAAGSVAATVRSGGGTAIDNRDGARAVVPSRLRTSNETGPEAAPAAIVTVAWSEAHEAYVDETTMMRGSALRTEAPGAKFAPVSVSVTVW